MCQRNMKNMSNQELKNYFKKSGQIIFCYANPLLNILRLQSNDHLS